MHPTNHGCLGIIAPRTSHRSPFGILERTFHQLMSCTSAPLWPPWVERPGRFWWVSDASSLRLRFVSPLNLLTFGNCRILQVATNTLSLAASCSYVARKEVSSAQKCHPIIFVCAACAWKFGIPPMMINQFIWGLNGGLNGIYGKACKAHCQTDH